MRLGLFSAFPCEQTLSTAQVLRTYRVLRTNYYSVPKYFPPFGSCAPLDT